MSERYPPLADYGFISDCHTAAIVSRAGSVDWMCVPRFDSGSCFGRLLDWDTGGHCTVAPLVDRFESSRRYVDGTPVLETVFKADEVEIGHLEGWRGHGPVRVGNAAACQTQLDACGQLVDQSWHWHRRGHSPDDDYWRFLVSLVDSAIARWRRPDAGIWEWRGEPKHFVHSKALCWVAADRGIRLAEECEREAPVERWRAARDEIRAAIESDGYDEERGVFVQAFGSRDLDAAVLRLPIVGFLDYSDERMLRTTDAVMDELADERGLLRRYRVDDGVAGRDAAFLPCSFWLAEVLPCHGRDEEARRIFDRAVSTGSDLGLFSEEYNSETGEPLGNFPQALTHLSHIAAALALDESLSSGEQGKRLWGRRAGSPDTEKRRKEPADV